MYCKDISFHKSSTLEHVPYLIQEYNIKELPSTFEATKILKELGDQLTAAQKKYECTYTALSLGGGGLTIGIWTLSITCALQNNLCMIPLFISGICANAAMINSLGGTKTNSFFANMQALKASIENFNENLRIFINEPSNSHFKSVINSYESISNSNDYQNHISTYYCTESDIVLNKNLSSILLVEMLMNIFREKKIETPFTKIWEEMVTLITDEKVSSELENKFNQAVTNIWLHFNVNPYTKDEYHKAFTLLKKSDMRFHFPNFLTNIFKEIICKNSSLDTGCSGLNFN